EEIDAADSELLRFDDARFEHAVIRMQAYTERRTRIVDHHLVLAGHVALSVVADGADAQASDVVADLHRQHHHPASAFRILHAVDQESHAHDGISRRYRNRQVAVDERGWLLR